MNKFHLAIISVLGLTLPAFSREELPQTERSLLQPEMETQIRPTGLNKADYATGNWWSYRDRLHDAGVDVFGFYNNIISGNVSGGLDSGHATYDHDIWLGAKFDLEKMFGWKGGLFAVSGINREGEDLTAKYIGSIYSTQQLVGGQRWFLYQVYLQQKLFRDQLTAKLGRFGASDDFNSSPLYGFSLNNGINGNIRNVLFDTRFSAYPFATWAGALFYEPNPQIHFKAGVFQTSEGMFENDDNGLNFGIGERDGYTAIFQVGWTPEFFTRPGNALRTDEKSLSARDGKTGAAPMIKGMPGHYWVGVTYSQWDLYRRFTGGFEDHSYGFYAHADQMLYQEAPGSDEGLTAFVASAYYPQTDISIVPFQLNVGLNYKGLVPGRGEDHTMLHFIYGKLSRDYARSVRVPGHGNAKSEEVLEFAHRIQITPWSYFQPDIQYVINPGGTGDISDAVVVGAQMGLTF
ncbi:MAG: porin [Chthoniobacter sp.]|jgi:porin|nr:porin [Chthoniobacter sp.]